MAKKNDIKEVEMLRQVVCGCAHKGFFHRHTRGGTHKVGKNALDASG